MKLSYSSIKNEFGYFVGYYILFMLGLSLFIEYARTQQSEYLNILFIDVVSTHFILFYFQYTKGFIFSDLNSYIIGSKIYKKYESKIMLISFGIIGMYGYFGYLLYKLYFDNSTIFNNIMTLIILASIFSIGNKIILEQHLKNLYRKNKPKDF